jgi:all-trans-retinol dehydrogenase (NAD+)
MSILLSTALNPLVTGPLLWAISTRAPAFVRERLLALIASLPFKLDSGILTSSLKWLFGIGLAGALNRFLSACALNGWRVRGDKERWDWPNEVAVITGGCSGFGAAITARLVAEGVSVAVLDVSPLPSRFANGEGHFLVSRVNHYVAEVGD